MYRIHTEYSQNTYRIFIECILNNHIMSAYYIQSIHRIHTAYSHNTYTIFTEYIQNMHSIHTEYSQNTYSIFTEKYKILT